MYSDSGFFFSILLLLKLYVLFKCLLVHVCIRSSACFVAFMSSQHVHYSCVWFYSYCTRGFVYLHGFLYFPPLFTSCALITCFLVCVIQVSLPRVFSFHQYFIMFTVNTLNHVAFVYPRDHASVCHHVPLFIHVASLINGLYNKEALHTTWIIFPQTLSNL